MAESSERSSRWSGSTGVGGVAPVEVSGSPMPYRIGPLDIPTPSVLQVQVQEEGCKVDFMESGQSRP